MWVYYRLRYARLNSFFTILLLLVGGLFLGYYITAPETQITSPIDGFAIATNQTMIRLTEFDLGLNADSGQLTLFGYWQYVNTTKDFGRDFNITVMLPFIIEEYLYSPSYTPSIANWKIINTNVTNVAASAVSANFSGNYTKSLSRYFYAQFIVANTYANSRRGSYQIVLPLDAGTDGPNFPNLTSFLWNESDSCCTVANEIFVYITFPKAAVNIQTFPQAKFGVNDANTLYFVQWNMTQRTQVSLYYVDQDQQSYFEISVIIGSLLLGAGISGIADWLKERSS
jgi:hypothetical protein